MIKAINRLLVFATFVTPVSAFGNDRLYDGDTSPFPGTAFVEFMGRPVSFSISNPYPGFWEKLKELDRENSFIKQPDSGWQPFTDADVWVFFLSSPDELDQLGYFANIITSEEQSSDVTIMQNFFFSFEEHGVRRDAYAAYIYIDRFQCGNMECTQPELACKTAHAVYERIVNTPEIERLQADKDCLNGV